MLVQKDLHDTKIQLHKFSLDFSLKNLQLALSINSKERFEAVKEDLDILGSSHRNLMLDIGYFATLNKKKKAAEAKSKAPIIAPKKLFETFVTSSIEAGKTPMLEDLIGLVTGQTAALQQQLNKLTSDDTK